MKALAVLLAATISASLAAQAKDSGTIRGRAVRADTGEPLRRVRIRVEQVEAARGGSFPSTLTDDEGRYELKDLTPGRYYLRATRGGFVDVSYGQRRPFERGRPIEVTAGQVNEGITFALPKGAVVAGRILDEAAEPVARASVSLARYQYVGGRRQLVGVNADSTDDRGEFRIFDVAPGEYYLVAHGNHDDFGGAERVRYVGTYYPGTALIGEAQRLSVPLGGEIGGLTLSLQRARTATVSGSLRMADGSPFPPIALITARAAERVPWFDSTSIAVAAGDGTFALTGLLPGTYVIEARVEDGADVGSTEVAIDDRDVPGVMLVLSKGAAARGRVQFDTGAPPPDVQPSHVLVTTASTDNERSFSGPGGPPRAQEDWTFEMRGLHGRRLIRAGTVGRWQMKSVHLEGVDVTDTPIDFRNGDVNGLVVTLTSRVITVSGTVRQARGGIATDATVVVFADDPKKWSPQSRFLRSARPDQQGRFTVEGLPPGRYLAIAVGYVEPGEEQNPEMLEQWRQSATSLTLSEGDTRVIDLQLSDL